MLHFHLCVLASFLVNAITPAIGGTTFQWVPNTNWLNPSNWNGSALPQAGDMLTFPASFSNFGSTQCWDSASCNPPGGIILLKATTDNPSAVTAAASVAFPKNGRLRLSGSTTIQLRSTTSKPAGQSTNVQWRDPSLSEIDFRCAANWVVQGTDSNPDFSIPCYQDAALFPSDSTFMVSIPSNTFIDGIITPANNPATSDLGQFSGSFSTDPSLCPLPFSSAKGAQYCALSCLNSCPEKNPSYIPSLVQQLSQNSSLYAVSTSTVSSLQDQQLQNTTYVTVNGSVAFPIPAGASSSVIASVSSQIEGIPSTYPFRLSVSCTTSASFISCQFTATVTTSQVAGFSSNTQAPFHFTDGFLLTSFNNLVQSWFGLDSQNEVLSQTQDLINNGFTSVSLKVPSRFVSQLGNPFPGDAFATSLASALSISSSNIFGSAIWSSNNVNYLVFSLSGSSQVQAQALSVLKSTTSVFNVTLANNSTVPIYIPGGSESAPTDASFVVVRSTLTNSALYAALPLSSTALDNLRDSISSYIVTQLGINPGIVHVLAQTVISSRRRSTSSTVALSLIIPSNSPLLAHLINDLFDFFSYNGGSSTTLTTNVLTFAATELAYVQQYSLELAQTASNLSSSVSSLVTSFSSLAGDSSTLVSGQYAFPVVNITNNPNVTFTTNELCSAFTSFVSSSQSTYQQNIASLMSMILPVAADSITFGSPITCGPVNSFQTLPSQAAQFSINNVTITAPYMFFPSSANNINVGSVVINSTLQKPDASAALGSTAVQSAVQSAFYQATVQLFASYYQAQVLNLNATLAAATATNSTANSATAAFPIIPIAAAAAGTVIITLIVVIVVVRRRRNPRLSRRASARVRSLLEKKGGTLVEYENPAFHPLNEGLYQNETDNPLFLSGESDSEDESARRPSIKRASTELPHGFLSTSELSGYMEPVPEYVETKEQEMEIQVQYAEPDVTITGFTNAGFAPAALDPDEIDAQVSSHLVAVAKETEADVMITGFTNADFGGGDLDGLDDLDLIMETNTKIEDEEENQHMLLDGARKLPPSESTGYLSIEAASLDSRSQGSLVRPEKAARSSSALAAGPKRVSEYVEVGGAQ